MGCCGAKEKVEEAVQHAEIKVELNQETAAMTSQASAEACFNRIAAALGKSGGDSLPLDEDFAMAFESVFELDTLDFKAFSQLLDRKKDSQVSLLGFRCFHEKWQRSGKSLPEYLTGAATPAVHLANDDGAAMSATFEKGKVEETSAAPGMLMAVAVWQAAAAKAQGVPVTAVVGVTTAAGVPVTRGQLQRSARP